jgi:hypothetical protein
MRRSVAGTAADRDVKGSDPVTNQRMARSEEACASTYVPSTSAGEAERLFAELIHAQQLELPPRLDDKRLPIIIRKGRSCR